MRIYLVRHPEPEVNSGTCYGRSDLDVSAEQCVRVGKALLSTLPRNVALYSSPLRRCAQLAHKLAPDLGNVPVMFDDRLMEMHFGQWELQPWDKIPRAEVDAWARDIVTYCPGGGENVLQMATRVREFHRELLRRPSENAVVICHAGTIRLLLACQRGLPLVEMARYAAQVRHTIGFGEAILLDI